MSNYKICILKTQLLEWSWDIFEKTIDLRKNWSQVYIGA